MQRLRDLNEGYDTWDAVRDALSVDSIFETNGKVSGKRSAKKPKSTRPRRKQTKTSTSPSDADEDDRNASEDGDDDLFSLFSDSGNEDEPVVEEASTDEEEEEEEKPSRRKKAGTGVRRPANRFNLYVIFNKMMRKQIAEENPDIDRHMLSRIVSERYRALTPVCRRQTRHVIVQ